MAEDKEDFDQREKKMRRVRLKYMSIKDVADELRLIHERIDRLEREGMNG